MRRVCTLLPAALLLIVFNVRSAGLPALDTSGAAAIDRMFQAAVDKGEIPGVVAAVTNKDQILYFKAFGRRDVARGIPMSTDTVFRIASMTKPVTSAGIMMLYEQGKLKLDDPVADYLPAYKGRTVISTFDPKDATYATRPAKSEMTIRQLLTHTAGLGYPFTSHTILAIQTKTGKDPKELPLLFDPGTKWNYSPGPALLGEIIEKLSGQSLEAWDQARIFTPLGMIDTAYTPAAEKAARLVTVHQRSSTGLVENPNSSVYVPDVRGDGGLVSTASDYSAFLQMFLNEGRWHGKQLLRPETVRLMTTNQIGSVVVDTMPAAMPARSAPFPFGAGTDKFGLGFQIAMTDGAATHERGAGSYSWGGINNTHFWVDPKNGIGVVILMQVLPFYDGVSMDVVKRFEKLIYQHLTLEAKPSADAPRNDLPQPYRTTRDWGRLPAGVKWAAVTAVEPAPDGTIYVIHRCVANSCAGRNEPPILKFDANGKLLKSWGEGLFIFPHGATVDRDGNLWVTDAGGAEGRGQQVLKFSPDGKVLMTLGKAGVSGSTPDLFDQPTDVLVAPSGDIFVTDSHRNGKNNRVVRFDRSGKFIKQWGTKGSGRGEMSEPHTIAMDSRGRLFVGDRENNRIQIFDQDGRYLDEWRQFGRPSGIVITKDDTIFVTDSESGPDTGAHELSGIRKGIRIGSARDGKVTAFIEDSESTAPDHSGAEGVGVDAQGNVYGAVVRRQMLERHMKK